MKALTCIAIIFALVAIAAGFFGLMFWIATVGDIAANQMTAMLLFGGAGGSLLIAIILAYLGQRQPERLVVEAHVDLPRDFDVSQITCPHCGGAPSRDDLAFERTTGAITLKCPYCHRVSELVEDIKW
jgi:hypothetical protein